MHCFGIDPSLSGTAVCYGNDSRLLPEQKPIGKSACDRSLRYKILCGHVDFLIGTYAERRSEVLIAIEGYSHNSNGNNSHGLVEYGWHLRSHLFMTYNADLIEVAPTVLKKFATGKGSGPKSVVIKEVYKRWNVDFDDDNCADAFVLAEIARCYVDQERCQNEIQRKIISDLKAYHAASV